MNKIMYSRHATGAYSLRQPNQAAYVSDQRGQFWTTKADQAIKFLTQEDAQACAEYLRTAIMAGVKCSNLLVVCL